MAIAGRIIHIVCIQGNCSLHFAGNDYTFGRGDCLVALDTHVHHIQPSEDCSMKTFFLTEQEHASMMPNTAWGVCGEFRFFTHPVFHVADADLSMLEHDLDEIERRSYAIDGEYQVIARQKAIELFYVDLVGIHQRLFCQLPASKSYAEIMNRFVSLLKNGTYIHKRKVEFYADELCITAKHLHKVCKEVSGRTPSHWIQRFTVMQARYLLRHEGKSQKEVAALLGFDNVAHFNRYISNSSGTTPKNIV